MGNSLLLIGGGGHCKSVLDCILTLGKFDEIGIIDSEKTGVVLGVKTVGNDDDLPRLFQEGWKSAFVSVGSVGDTRLRRKLYRMVREIGFSIPTIIDETAVVANDVKIAEGAFVAKHTTVNAGSRIGECAIINTGAIVEHDCTIGAFAHISSGTTLCGQVVVGDDSHIGAGSVVKQQIQIGAHVLLGAGSVVVHDIPDDVKAYGNPCRAVKQ